MDEAHSSPGLHAAAGPGLAEECATLVYFVLTASAVVYCYELNVEFSIYKYDTWNLVYFV